MTRSAHEGRVNDMAVFPGGQRFASVGDDGRVRVWDLPQVRCVRTFSEHKGAVHGVGVGANGYLATGASDETVRVWHVDGPCIARAPMQVTRPLATTDVLSQEDRFAGLIRRAERALGSKPQRAYEFVRAAMEVPGFARSPRAMQCLTELAKTGRRLGLRNLWEKDAVAADAIDCGSLAITSDGSVVVGGGVNGQLHMWDLQKGTLRQSVELDCGPVKSLAISPDDGRCAVGTDEWLIRFIGLESVQSELSWEVGDAPVTALVFSSHRSRLFAGGADGRVEVLDANNGRRIAQAYHYAESVEALACCRGGEDYVTAGEDGSLLFWTVSCRHPVRCVRGDGTPVTTLAFSPGEGYLLSGNAEGQVSLWDWSYGAPALHWLADTHSIVGLEFNPEATAVVSAAAGGKMAVWQLRHASDRVVLSGQREIKLSMGGISCARFASNAFVGVAAGKRTGLSVVEIDWDLDFEPVNPWAEPLRKDKPWAGLTAKEVWLLNIRHYGLRFGNFVRDNGHCSAALGVILLTLLYAIFSSWLVVPITLIPAVPGYFAVMSYTKRLVEWRENQQSGTPPEVSDELPS
jgi:WD40 repeat protein